MLSLFEFLLAGLVCMVLVCAAWKARARTGEPRLLLLLACAFVLLSGHFLYDVFDAYLELSNPAARMYSAPLETFAEALQTLSFALLLACYRPAPNGLRRAVPVLAGVLYLGPGQAAAVNWVLLTLLLVALACRRTAAAWLAATPVLAAMLSAGCRLMQPPRHSAWSPYVWFAEQLLMLASLALFALVIERRTRSLYLTLFVRMNLIFVVIAGLLALVVAYAERAQLTQFEITHLEQLSEFLRGQALRSSALGRSADMIVADPAIVRKVVSEFGNLPALRRVRVRIYDRTMEMAIERAGVVSHAVFPGSAGAEPEPPAVYYVNGERLATLARVPIRHEGRLVGQIELDETLAAIDMAIAWQISRMFLAFTALVLLSGGLIGLTVRSANRTIQTQYEEIERANKQLLQAAKLASVGELAGGVAHEINNPAGIIVTRADYMLAIEGQPGAAQELAEGIKVVRSQAERISAVVRGLLTFSRPSQPRIAPLDLNDVLQQSLMLIRPRCRAAGIRVTDRLEDGLPAASADANQIGQVFVNILNNAIDAMPDGGELTVRTGLQPPGMVFASIADTGRGISEQHLPKIFDPFFTTKPPGKGTGLGLAISYGIIRDHGGAIRVSTAINRGTSFTIVLPARG